MPISFKVTYCLDNRIHEIIIDNEKVTAGWGNIVDLAGQRGIYEHQIVSIIRMPIKG